MNLQSNHSINDTIYSIIILMKNSMDHSSIIDNLISELEEREKNTKFSRLLSICEELFGAGRINGSHHIFKTPLARRPSDQFAEGRENGKAISSAPSGSMSQENEDMRQLVINLVERFGNSGLLGQLGGRIVRFAHSNEKNLTIY